MSILNNDGVFQKGSGGAEFDPISLHLDQTVPQTTVGTFTFPQIKDSGLTSGRVPFAGASGLFLDDANFTFDTAYGLLKVKSAQTGYPSAYNTIEASGIGSGGYGTSNVLAVTQNTTGILCAGFDLANWAEKPEGIFNFYGDHDQTDVGYTRYCELNINDTSYGSDKRVITLEGGIIGAENYNDTYFNFLLKRDGTFSSMLSIYKNRVGVNRYVNAGTTIDASLHIYGEGGMGDPNTAWTDNEDAYPQFSDWIIYGATAENCPDGKFYCTLSYDTVGEDLFSWVLHIYQDASRTIVVSNILLDATNTYAITDDGAFGITGTTAFINTAPPTAENFEITGETTSSSTPVLLTQNGTVCFDSDDANDIQRWRDASGVTLGRVEFDGVIDAPSYKAGGTSPVADGTYTVGNRITPVTGDLGQITVKGGIITDIQEAT